MSKKKFEFSNEQIEYIINNWGTESAHSMKKRFGCTWYAVVNVAKDAGLEMPSSNKWTTEEINDLKTLAQTYHYIDIAQMMNKSTTAIYLKARKLGIDLIQSKKDWTIEDEAYLKDNWGYYSIETISKNMKRSIYSLKVKANRMKLGSMIQSNIKEISVSDICDILDVSKDRIFTTWKNQGLKLKQKTLTKKYKYYCISTDDLLSFLEKHQDLWNSQNLEENILGEEPLWLLQKRKKDLIEDFNEYTLWTDKETELAKEMLLKGFNYEEIASKVNHTPTAIAIKLRSLGLSYRLSSFWKGSELKFLKDNYQNMTQEEIGKKLNRSTKAVGAKAAEMGYQKKLKQK